MLDKAEPKKWLDSQGRPMVNWVQCDLESQQGKRVGFRRSLKLKHMRAVAQMATMADVDFGANQAEALDAFSQALTNPLMSEHVFNADTFTEWGLGEIEKTDSLWSILVRNVPGGLPPEVTREAITMTRHDWRRRWSAI